MSGQSLKPLDGDMIVSFGGPTTLTVDPHEEEPFPLTFEQLTLIPRSPSALTPICMLNFPSAPAFVSVPFTLHVAFGIALPVTETLLRESGTLCPSAGELISQIAVCPSGPDGPSSLLATPFESDSFFDSQTPLAQLPEQQFLLVEHLAPSV